MGRIAASIFLGLSLVVSSECLASVRQLTFPPIDTADLWPQFSPRGDKVAFARKPVLAGNPLPFVLVVDVATGAEDTLVTGLPEWWTPNMGAAWSRDGNQFAFNQNNGALWIADVPAPPAQPLPRLVAVVEGMLGASCLALFAIDDRGTVYVDCGTTGTFEVAGHVAGIPVHMTSNASTPRRLLITMANGDVWGSSLEGGAPFTFNLVSNVFASAGVTGVEGAAPRVGHRLDRARPNPFNPTTKIPYALGSGGRVTIKVFDVRGRLVRTVEDATRPAGQHVAQWDGRTDNGQDASSGTYFGKIIFPDGTHSERKLTIIR